MATEELQLFADKLGRPAGSLSAFSRLTRDQIAMLNAAIDRTCKRQREGLDQPFARQCPGRCAA
jgi:hypothetical protein